MHTSNLTYGEKVSMRLTLDVTYELNGENATEMVNLLRKLCERAIGNGMLTGESDATAETYTMDVVCINNDLAEEEIASFMLSSIESGAIPLEQIPDRLARYGLMDRNAFIDEMLERMDATTPSMMALTPSFESAVPAIDYRPASTLIQFQSRPRVLVVVSGGIADPTYDPGVDVAVFDWDNFKDDPVGTGGVPAGFADLAGPLGIPVAQAGESLN